MFIILITALLSLFFYNAISSRTTDNNCTEQTCSYNGVCVNNSCFCDAGWKGRYCERLDLLPAHNGSGMFDLLYGKSKTSSWGGSVVVDDNGTYHMWYSEISRHCGIHSWLTNSVVSHAIVTNKTNWKFEKKEVVFPRFSHEPIVVRDPSSREYVMFLTHNPDGSHACNCTDGSSASVQPGCNGAPKNMTLYSYFSYASNPNGPWSELVSLEHVQGSLSHADMNLAPVILENGTAVAWTRWSIWRADNWRDPLSWKDTGQAPDWDHGGEWEGEDPSMWRDKKRRFHILSHNGKSHQGGTSSNPRGDCGRHLFSETGAAGTWRIAPLPLGGCAYPRVNVSFVDGSNRSFYGRERPHLIFAGDGFTPVALSTSAFDSPTGPADPDFEPPQRDASYTLIQPINSGARMTETTKRMI